MISLLSLPALLKLRQNKGRSSGVPPGTVSVSRTPNIHATGPPLTNPIHRACHRTAKKDLITTTAGLGLGLAQPNGRVIMSIERQSSEELQVL